MDLFLLVLLFLLHDHQRDMLCMFGIMIKLC